MRSKIVEHIIRRVTPSTAILSYNPIFRVIGNAVSDALGAPFPEFRTLPPNHLRVRVGVGNQILNNHAYFFEVGSRFWHECFANGYVKANSDIVEIGCGCGRLAVHLNADYFSGAFLGIDIDLEMVNYCSSHFPPERFSYRLSPHKSSIYRAENGPQQESKSFVIASPESKDFIYSLSLFTHLLEQELTFYMRESFRTLRRDGIIFMTFFCLEHVDKGGRWTFAHRTGNAYVENEKYPEAAVAYTGRYMSELARECEFRDVSILGRPGQSVLLAHK